jgi:hypothetical protein
MPEKAVYLLGTNLGQTFTDTLALIEIAEAEIERMQERYPAERSAN